MPFNFLDKIQFSNKNTFTLLFLLSFSSLVFGLCNSNSIPPLPEGRRGGAAVTLPVSEFSTWSRHDGLEEIEDESVEALIYCGGIDNLNRKVFIQKIKENQRY